MFQYTVWPFAYVWLCVGYQQQNCTHLYFETGLAQLKKTCSEDLKINGLIEELIKRFKYEKCLVRFRLLNMAVSKYVCVCVCV